MNMNALVADDDVEALSSAINILNYSKIDVVAIASNGKIAFERYKRQPANIDIIVTDLEMPRLSGLELTKKITEYTVKHHLPRPTMICVSGKHNSDELRKEMAESNIDFHFEKPFKVKEFISILEKINK